MSYSKSRVNRAGQALAEVLQELIANEALTVERQQKGLEAMEVVEWWRGEHARPLSRVAANLRYYVAEEGDPVVAQRLKKVPTIAHKLMREPGMKLARMADIGGVRAILPDQRSAYRVATRLRHNWTIYQFRDYVKSPKPDGYRALHLINRHHGRLIEVQLRTENQDFWANAVERFSRRIAPGLKFGSGPPELADFLRAAAAFFSYEDREEPAPEEFLEEMEELLTRADTFMERLR